MYTQIIRPLLFHLDAEHVHDLIIRFFRFYRYLGPLRSLVRRCCHTQPADITVCGIHLKNRIGLSAGFDKNGAYFDELADFGFGFLELGTVTVHPQPGNPKPRIFRLPQDESLISRTGFNNIGLKQFQANLKRHRHGRYVIGVNINRDPKSEGKDAEADFLYLFQALYPSVSYFTLNWGSVNDTLFAGVLKLLNDYRKSEKKHRPIFIKLPADLPPEEIGKVMEMADANDIEGFIATGPTMKRDRLPHYTKEELDKIGPGGVSGRGIGTSSYDTVRYLRAHEIRPLVIIGAGGIMNKEDALLMRRAGADLIQIYSAFIYSGPCVIKRMIRYIRKKYV